jgi:hypothetical protein
MKSGPQIFNSQQKKDHISGTTKPSPIPMVMANQPKQQLSAHILKAEA